MFNKEKHRDKYPFIMFQMFIYAFLHKQEFGNALGAYLSVYQLPVIDKCGPITIRITNDQLEMFSDRLAGLLKEIREKVETPGSSMKVCKSVDTCKYCDFNKYCGRSYKDE